MIDHLIDKIPLELRPLSGEVFYSGRSSFREQGGVYILGANPGSRPDRSDLNTVQKNIDFFLDHPQDRWSSYLDVGWDAAPGQVPMQRNIAHLAERVGIDLRNTPSSNVIFTRSKSIAELALPWKHVVNLCWPFHDAVLEIVRPRAIICFGRDAADAVIKRLGRGLILDQFVEQNDRGWISTASETRAGPVVFDLTHPGRAHWRNAATDPSAMVRNVLAR